MNKIFDKLDKNELMQIMKNSFITLMPFTIVSSFFVLVINFPVGFITSYMENNFSVLWMEILPSIPNAFNEMISLYVLLSLAYNFSKVKNTNPILYIMVSLFSYIIFLTGDTTEQFILSLGSTGIFFSMLCTISSCYLLFKFSSKANKSSVQSAIPKEVLDSFRYLLPLVYTTIIILGLKIVLHLLNIPNPSIFINDIIQVPIMRLGSSLPAILIINFGITILWFFGFNGSYIFNTIMNPIYISLNMENLFDFTSGEIPQHVITGTFQSLFINYGGSGSTIALILSILIVSRSRERKTLAKLALIPSFFNINEPIVYGFPIILNFKMLIPFILCPLINTIVAYYSMYWGIVEKTNGIQIPWTTPAVISGFLASGITGAVLQLSLIILNVIIYCPFVFRNDGFSEVDNYRENK